MAKKKTKRPGKGESLFRFIDDYTAVDIETTGLSPARESIIEIGAIRVRSGIEVARFDELINPEREIPKAIEKLTGITNDMVKDARLCTDVLSAFREFLGDDIILGHNVNFDVDFLYDNSVRLGFGPLSNDYVDTMRISRRVHKDFTHHRLQDLAEYYGLDYTHAHRAVNDCENTHLAYRRMFDLKPKEFQ